MLYRDPHDSRIFVPRKGGGVALNFSHRLAWAVLVGTTIIPLLVVAAVLIAFIAS